MKSDRRSSDDFLGLPVDVPKERPCPYPETQRANQKAVVTFLAQLQCQALGEGPVVVHLSQYEHSDDIFLNPAYMYFHVNVLWVSLTS